MVRRHELAVLAEQAVQPDQQQRVVEAAGALKLAFVDADGADDAVLAARRGEPVDDGAGVPRPSWPTTAPTVRRRRRPAGAPRRTTGRARETSRGRRPAERPAGSMSTAYGARALRVSPSQTTNRVPPQQHQCRALCLSRTREICALAAVCHRATHVIVARPGRRDVSMVVHQGCRSRTWTRSGREDARFFRRLTARQIRSTTACPALASYR